MTTFIKHATDLADQLITRYCRQDGLLARKANCVEGIVADDRLLADEIGDYCQYVIALGKRTDRVDLRQWGEQQVLGLLDTCQTKNGLIYPLGKPDRVFGFFPTIRMGDTFWGLQAVYQETGNVRIGEAFRSFTAQVLGAHGYCGLPAYGLLMAGGFSTALPLAETMSSGYVAESLIEMSRASDNLDDLTAARGILDGWMRERGSRIGAFERRGLHQHIPALAWALDFQFRARGRPGIRESILTKGDTFLLFAMLAEFKISGDPQKRQLLENWVTHMVDDRSTPDGRFFNQWHTATGVGRSVRLEENHSAIELLLDIAYFLEYQPALEAATKAALCWASKVGAAGLVANDDSAEFAEIDPMLDLLVNLLKLAEIGGRPDIRDQAFAAMQALLSGFALPYGYAHRSSMADGVPLGPVVEAKYLGLLIKGLLLFDHVERGEAIMGDQRAHLLATDR